MQRLHPEVVVVPRVDRGDIVLRRDLEQQNGVVRVPLEPFRIRLHRIPVHEREHLALVIPSGYGEYRTYVGIPQEFPVLRDPLLRRTATAP